MDKEGKMVIFCLLLAAMSYSVFTQTWSASVVKNLDALESSCVVIPCSFTHPEGNVPTSRLRGIWHLLNNKDQRIYHKDDSLVLDSFKDRTQFLGDLGRSNCTLEIIKIKDRDNGPFCFRIELLATDKSDKFSFVEDCVELTILHDPPKPTLHHPKTAIQGHPYTITCSVTHTCSSYIPKLTWSRDSANEVVEVNRQINLGYWETQSILTFIAEEKDDHSEVTCTAHFNGEKTSSAALEIYVKREKNYNHIIIPTVVGIGTAVIFGVFCIIMAKKYKKRIAELQSQDGSMWNRLSRISRRMRYRGSQASQSDQRRPRGDMLDLGHMPNKVNSKSCTDQKISKPRFPSPRSQPKSCNYKEDLDDGDDYMNTANIYGNL